MRSDGRMYLRRRLDLARRVSLHGAGLLSLRNVTVIGSIRSCGTPVAVRRGIEDVEHSGPDGGRVFFGRVLVVLVEIRQPALDLRRQHGWKRPALTDPVWRMWPRAGPRRLAFPKRAPCLGRTSCLGRMPWPGRTPWTVTVPSTLQKPAVPGGVTPALACAGRRSARRRGACRPRPSGHEQAPAIRMPFVAERLTFRLWT